MKLHPASRAMLLSMLFAALVVVGCSPEADSGAEPANQVDALGAAAAALPDAVPAREEPAAQPGVAARALDPVPCTPDVDSLLVINEIMADPLLATPGGSDLYGEWIEIYNPGATPVDLQGYVLADQGTDYHIIGAPVVVPPNGYVVLCRDNNPDLNGGVACNYMYLNFLLVNGGDAVILRNPQGDVVDQVVYTGTSPVGASIALRNPNMSNASIAIPANPNDSASWTNLNFGVATASFGVGDKGTPGAKNTDVWKDQPDSECNDNQLCTLDVCDDGFCRNTWISGCCNSTGDCVDGDICTFDHCNTITNRCTNDPIPNCCTTSAQCQDDNPCNADYCLSNQCRHSAYNIVPGCCYAPADKHPFTGLPWASETERQLFGDSQCDDKNFCTPDFCNLGTNLCYQGPAAPGCCNVNTDCDDGNLCTYDLCFNHTCSNPLKQAGCCVTDADCQDNDPCTTDKCVLGTCRFLWSSTECCFDNRFCEINADDGNPCTQELCVQNTATGRYECQHPFIQNCTLPLPYIETFNTVDSFSGAGYTPMNLPGSTPATNHWLLATTAGVLGPDKHVLFDWFPNAQLVKNVLASPTIDASTSHTYLPNQFTKQTTVQWRMAYEHSQPGTPITLRVIATASNDFVNGFVLWAATTTQDIPYDLISVELPEDLKYSPTLRLGFVVDTGNAWTIAMEKWEIDDVKVGAGVANELVKSMVYTCPGGSGDCLPGIQGTLRGTAGPGEQVPDIEMGVCEWTRIYLCYNDEDASQNTTWNFYGFPGAYLDGAPLDRPSFISQTPTLGLGLGCETNPTFVRSVCGAGVVANIYCAIDVKPNCADALAGDYIAGLVCKDEGDPTKPAQSPFESLVKVKVSVVLEDGYIVWSPNGAADASAVAIRDQIVASGRRAQIVTDLDRITDLTRYDGVFAVLGVYGRYHVVNAAQATRLKSYLDAGGRIYLEGGEFFFTDAGTQPLTAIHEYFKTTATADGVSRQDGPVVGANFLHGYDYNLSQNALFNSWNDRLTHTPGMGGRQILRNGGATEFASVVSYDGVAQGGSYRSLASAISFGGLAAQSTGKTTRELMGKYLDFLENGYPPCTDGIQCEDFEVCTDDACAGTCVNTPRDECRPCMNDKFALDGSYSCGLDEACDVARGYCVPIVGQRFDVNVGSCLKFFGSGPTQASCIVNVPQPGLVEDVQVKVKVEHYYRGDTELELTSPSGASVMLKAANPADARANVYATYDVGVPSVGDLNAFNGGSLSGAWNLVVRDVDPMIYNGYFEEWHLFATYGMLACDDDSDCPTDDLCATYECSESFCVPTPTDCDDLQDCTIDRCDPATGACIHEVISGCDGECTNHAECANHEVCLTCDPDDPTCTLRLERTCDPVNDFDPLSGEVLCRCSPIPGNVYALTAGLPVPIPDNNPSGITRMLTLTDPGFVNGLKVKVRTNHASMGDLKAVLCHEGVCVTLRASQGGTNHGFFDVYDYDLEAGPGTVADFDRLPIAGLWTLIVSDVLPGDAGTLTHFALYITPADCYGDAQCNDNNPCTVDVCQNPSTGGTCTHTLVTCQPSTDSCLTNQCNPANGQCEPVAQVNGTACEDGLYCTEDDTCQAGVCTGGSPRSCALLDGVCRIGVCSEDLRQCIIQAAPENSPCDDGQLCTEGDFCQAGNCMPGPTMVCRCPTGLDSECAVFEDGNKCNGSDWRCNAAKMCELMDGPVICPDSPLECVSNVCVPVTGLCVEQPSLNFMPCEDGVFCTISDYCLSGACQGGTIRSCEVLDDQCKVGFCDEDADACIPVPKEAGTICEADGFGCTIDECDALGSCRYKENVSSCSEVADDCNDGVCQNVGWGNFVCVKGPLADGTVCTDEPNPCTQDICQSGWCEHILLQNCNGPCGGKHPFDAGDDVCGVEDSCEDGYLGYPNGRCTPTCNDANCVRVASAPELGLVIDEKLACTMAPLDVATTFQYVESVEAKVKLDHSYLADLAISLIDPQGYEHTVWNHIGGGNDNMNNTFDLSLPVPYPFPNAEQRRLAGVPMCSFAGEQAAGTWWLKICDTGADNGGVLRNWKLYVRGTNTANLNPGHRCETAIDLGNQDVNPAITVPGTTECAINSIAEASSCGGLYGPDRTYKFDLTEAKRVTVRLFQPVRDLLLFLKEADGATCADGFLRCEQTGGWTPGAGPEEIDMQLQPGVYYVGVDTPGSMASAQFNYGPFSFELRVKTLLPNGAACVDPILGPQDLDCASQHCQNGYCCDAGDCCPGGQWVAPEEGQDPEAIKANVNWISANAICPEAYKVDPICFDPDTTDPLNPINECQGERYDANCVDHRCQLERVPDDVACDVTVEADRCGYFRSVFCSDAGDLPPWVQSRPPCPTFCQTDADCDSGAHCDPAVATDPDPDVGYDLGTGLPLKWCQPDLPNGAASNEASDCISGYSANGYCCDGGDCCPTPDVAGALTCPAAYYEAATCTDTSNCTGHRYDPVCGANNQCGSVFVRDDCDCAGQLSDNCGLYVPVFCGASPTATCPATAVGGGEWIAGDPACLDNCETAGADDDSKCDDIARCDLCDAAKVAAGDCDAAELGVRVCMANVPNGFPCDEGSDCENKLTTNSPNGHCSNGFCCDSGVCCNQRTDCPTQTPPSAFWQPPVCDDFATCQGHRVEAACWNDPSECDPALTPAQCAARVFSCGSVNVDDDSACVYNPANPASECGYYISMYCNGEADQTPGNCPTTCLVNGVETDALCDPNAHCDPDPDLLSNSICLPDLENDEPCDEASDCVAQFCQMHFCCDPEGCCAGCRVASVGVNLASGGTVDHSDGENVGVVVSLGQPSVIDSRYASGRHGADFGFLSGLMIRLYCWDLERNGGETDVDCGGGVCGKCESGMFCKEGPRDCLSGKCESGICVD